VSSLKRPKKSELLNKNRYRSYILRLPGHVRFENVWTRPNELSKRL
jgi:hypothetical protein